MIIVAWIAYVVLYMQFSIQRKLHAMCNRSLFIFYKSIACAKQQRAWTNPNKNVEFRYFSYNYFLIYLVEEINTLCNFCGFTSVCVGFDNVMILFRSYNLLNLELSIILNEPQLQAFKYPHIKRRDQIIITIIIVINGKVEKWRLLNWANNKRFEGSSFDQSTRVTFSLYCRSWRVY